MLAQKYRLKKKKDFEKVVKKGKFFSDKFLVLKRMKNDLIWTRVGLVVSRKISKKAVMRNKIKRRIREVVRTDLNKIKPGYDIIFFSKKGIEEKESWEIKESLQSLLRKARLLKIE